MIYFAALPTGGIKIGYSDDVPARMRKLEWHYGVPLVLLHTEPGGRPEEGDWHERFAHLRLGTTEQFRPGPDLMDAIGRPLLVGVNPETVEAIEPLNTDPVISMKGSAEFRDWLHRLADHQRVTAVQCIELALVDFARARGFPEPAPKRTK